MAAWESENVHDVIGARGAQDSCQSSTKRARLDCVQTLRLNGEPYRRSIPNVDRAVTQNRPKKMHLWRALQVEVVHYPTEIDGPTIQFRLRKFIVGFQQAKLRRIALDTQKRRTKRLLPSRPAAYQRRMLRDMIGLPRTIAEVEVRFDHIGDINQIALTGLVVTQPFERDGM